VLLTIICVVIGCEKDEGRLRGEEPHPVLVLLQQAVLLHWSTLPPSLSIAFPCV